MKAILRFGNGMPDFRLEGLQASLYIPLPDATQWDIISKPAPSPLIHQAAQPLLLHSDDTPMKVLSLMKERARAEAGGAKPVAKANQHQDRGGHTRRWGRRCRPAPRCDS